LGLFKSLIERYNVTHLSFPRKFAATFFANAASSLKLSIVFHSPCSMDSLFLIKLILPFLHENNYHPVNKKAQERFADKQKLSDEQKLPFHIW
jgi:hypothetical protein